MRSHILSAYSRKGSMFVPIAVSESGSGQRVKMLSEAMVAVFRLQLQSAMLTSDDPDFQEAAMLVLGGLGHRAERN